MAAPRIAWPFARRTVHSLIRLGEDYVLSNRRAQYDRGKGTSLARASGSVDL
jgi:hypothetical protein